MLYISKLNDNTKIKNSTCYTCTYKCLEYTCTCRCLEHTCTIRCLEYMYMYV